MALEKTEWGTTSIIFLGNLLDGKHQLICVPLEKKLKAMRLLNEFADKKKATVKQLQVLAGYLNFLSRAIFGGWAFTRRICSKYAATKGKQPLKHYHHMALDKEFKFDLEVWRIFLVHYHTKAVCRPMVDLDYLQTAQQLNFASDASAAKRLGFGAVFGNRWIQAQWEPGFIKAEGHEPSIAYLELYTVTAAILTWCELIKNTRVVVFYDNMSAVQMINQSTSACRNCMYLIRLLTLNGLVNN